MDKPLNVKQLQKLLRGKHINDSVKLVCGKLIGSGIYRDVYVLKQNPGYVVKIERDMSTATFSNVTEWRNYIDFQHWKPMCDWLAPCVMINQTGQVLIQKRVYWDGKKRKDYPKYIPSMFTDLKLRNFGWIGNRFVCCDYSFFRLPHKSKKMVYAKWWGTLKVNALL